MLIFINFLGSACLSLNKVPTLNNYKCPLKAIQKQHNNWEHFILYASSQVYEKEKIKKNHKHLSQKMPTLSSFLLFVFITSSFKIGSSIEVHVMNALPKGSAPMEIRCNSRSTNLDAKQLKSGDDYRWIVQKERATYLCAALWVNKIASWHGFQPRRDANQKSVFWLVKENGFFLGFDNSSWVKKSTWESEW